MFKAVNFRVETRRFRGQKGVVSDAPGEKG